MLARHLKRLALAAGMIGALAAQAQPGHEPPHGMPPPAGEFAPPLPPFLHGVKLSESQQDEIFAILHAQAPQMREKAKAVHQARESLRDQVMSGRFDEARAQSLTEAHAQALAGMDLLRARSDRQILALLTPEQRQAIGGKNCR